MDYLRIGTQFYRMIEQPLTSGDKIKKIVKWTREALVDDKGKSYIAEIPKFNGFCCMPNHLNYSRIVSDFYNQYEPIDYTPATENKEPTEILNFLRHIFREQYEIGLDYLTIIYLKPTQVLPILCLVSDERKTGKTTFLNLLKKIFGANMTINTNQDFRSQFNSDWTGKLIIGVDETFLEKKEDSERIKNLSTGKYYKSESKGKDKIEVEFFGKFILCSNNEDSFIKVDKDEIRYWVRKIPMLESENVNLLDIMYSEIPYFLKYLIDRGIQTERTTRMWFEQSTIYTPALEKLFKGNKTFMEIELTNILKDIMLEFNVTEVYYSQKDIFNLLKNNGIKTSVTQLQRLLDSWNLTAKNSSYEKFTIDLSGNKSIENIKGRFYTFNLSDFISVDSANGISEYFKGFETQIEDFENLDNKMQILIEYNKETNTNLSMSEFEILLSKFRTKKEIVNF